MYCELSSAYSGFRPVQLTERQREKHDDLLMPAVELTPPLPPAPQHAVHAAPPAAAASPASAYGSDTISDRRLLLVLAGLVVILLFVVILLVVQLSHAQMAMLRYMTWR